MDGDNMKNLDAHRGKCLGAPLGPHFRSGRNQCICGFCISVESWPSWGHDLHFLAATKNQRRTNHGAAELKGVRYWAPYWAPYWTATQWIELRESLKETTSFFFIR